MEPLFNQTTLDGSMILLSVDDQETNGEKSLSLFMKNISLIWPNLFSTMKSNFDNYGYTEHFPPKRFLAHIHRMTPDKGEYMADKSSYLLRFDFELEKFVDGIPYYDFFLSDDLSVVRAQPLI